MEAKDQSTREGLSPAITLAGGERLYSLDTYRGLTMMLLDMKWQIKGIVRHVAVFAFVASTLLNIMA